MNAETHGIEALPDGARPLFLLGAPRSGTTYAARLLDAHPEVLMTDEVRVFTFFEHAVFNARTNSFAPEDAIAEDDRKIVINYQREDGTIPTAPVIEEGQRIVVLPRPRIECMKAKEWKRAQHCNRRHISGKLLKLYMVRITNGIN